MSDTEEKTSLARDGTMQATAKEGIAYLKSEGKDSLLKAQGLDDDKPEEAEAILDGNKPDEDAKTRGQDKKLEELKNEEEPPAKKSRLAKDTTMAATAKEAKTILAGEKLADTRQETAKSKAKSPLKKNTTIVKTVEEAKSLLDGDVDVSSGRQTRSQSRGDTPKAPLKKAGRGKAKKAVKAAENSAEEEAS